MVVLCAVWPRIEPCLSEQVCPIQAKRGFDRVLAGLHQPRHVDSDPFGKQRGHCRHHGAGVCRLRKLNNANADHERGISHVPPMREQWQQE